MLSLCCGLLKWLVKRPYLSIFLHDRLILLLRSSWQVSDVFQTVYLQEGWWLETFSRRIYFCYNWSFASAWCYFSFDNFRQTLDCKCHSIDCVGFNISYVCTCLSSMPLPLQFFGWSSFLLFLQIGVAFLLVLLLMILAIGAIHHWASNNFYLSRTQMVFVCFLAFLLALAAFLVGWFEGTSQDYDLGIDTQTTGKKWLTC